VNKAVAPASRNTDTCSYGSLLSQGRRCGNTCASNSISVVLGREANPGPITTERGREQSCGSSFAQHGYLWLWVPAFAGTTSGESAVDVLRQQHRVRAGHGLGAVRHRLLQRGRLHRNIFREEPRQRDIAGVIAGRFAARGERFAGEIAAAERRAE